MLGWNVVQNLVVIRICLNRLGEGSHFCVQRPLLDASLDMYSNWAMKVWAIIGIISYRQKPVMFGRKQKAVGWNTLS